MTSYRVDDRDPEIKYSKPASGGHWTENGSSDSYEGTLTFTRTRNANATVTFTGTSISVFGVVSKSGTGSIQSSRYSVDGAYTSTYVSSPTSSTQNQVLFYSSGTLPNGQHTLLLVNPVELDFLWIDYFSITQAPITSGSATTAVQQPPVVVSTTNKVVVPSPSPSTLVVTEVLTSTIVDGSSTRLSVVTTTKSEVVQITAGVSDAVSAVSLESQASSTGLGSTNAGTESTEKNQAPIGAIVGGVIGGIAVIILLLILIVLLKRKRKSKFSEGMSSGGASGSLLVQQSDHPSVVPFAASRPPPTVSSSSYTQSSTNPPSTLAQSGAFNQGYVAGGSAGVSLGSAGVPSAEMGKRQYMAQYLENTQHQREVEQDQNRTNATSLSDGTQYSEPLSTHPLLPPPDDSPPSYYQLHSSAGLGETGERIVAELENVRKS